MKDDFDSTNKHISRYEDPMWDESTEELRHRLVSVKRVSRNNFKKHSWKVLDNKKQVMLLDSDSFSDSVVEFLLKPEGISTIIRLYKEGKNEEAIVTALNSLPLH
jgi:hypothetical protein